jgi:hypothetical protein
MLESRMFVSDKLVFLELQKTGCTHIREALVDLVGGELRGKHNQASAALFLQPRVFLGSVRDPWDWYLSLWAYGCDGKGALYDRATTAGWRWAGLGWGRHPGAAWQGFKRRLTRDVRPWQRVYRDVNDAGAFRAWLDLMHDETTRHDIGEGYGTCAMSRVAGLMSYRFVRLFCNREGELQALDALDTLPRLTAYVATHCFVRHIIRMEHLEADLLAALAAAGVAVPPEQQAALLARGKTNTSSRRRDPASYYDAASLALVGERERLLVERFGYTPPQAASA